MKHIDGNVKLDARFLTNAQQCDWGYYIVSGCCHTRSSSFGTRFGSNTVKVWRDCSRVDMILLSRWIRHTEMIH